MKKLISVLCVMAMVLGMAIPCTATTRTGKLSVVGEYTDETKDEKIQEILENDPNALIFTSIEEYETYLNEIQNIMVSTSVLRQARTTDKTMHIAMTIGLSKVNVYYDFALNDDGTVYKIYKDTVSSSMTGLSPGVTYQQNRLSVTKKDSTHILSDLSYTLTYYLLIEDLVQWGTEDFRYKLTHDVTTNNVTYEQIV